jgi:peptide/nickel transport system substrate-binding protein
MRNLRWQILIALGGLLLVVGLLLNQSPTAENVGPQPVSGGVHTEGLIGTPVRLNPVLDSYNQVDRDVDRLIYSGLIKFDSRGDPEPDLASEWAVSADGKTYTVALREDATWHDGQPVTTADVIYTFSKFQDDDYPGPSDLHDFWKQIKMVKLDDHTIQFQLPEPFAPFLDYLSVGLLPDHLLRGVVVTDLIDHPFNLHPIGTGPFTFDRFLTDNGRITGVTLNAFDGYYGKVAYLSRVEFRYFNSDTAAYTALQAGDVEAISEVSPDTLPDILAQPTLNVHTARLPQTQLIYLNLKDDERAFFQDKGVRQALELAINRQSIVDRVLKGEGVVATGPILPGNWAYSAELQPIPFDPNRAAALLDDAGWQLPAGATPGGEGYVRAKDDVELAFTMKYPDTPQSTQIANMVQTYWANIGVRVDLEPDSADNILQSLNDRDYEAALAEINLSRYPDPDPYPFWHDSQAESGQNYSGLVDRNIGIWLEQARTTTDRARRAQLYQSFQHRFQDQVPALLLFHPVYTYAISAEVRGVTMGPILDPSDRFANIVDWFLLARRSVGGAAPGTTPEVTPSP